MALLVIGVLLGLGLAACTSKTDSITADQNNTNTQLNTYQKNQPAPNQPYSQYRQTVIDVENAQIHGVATTTFFFNLGTPKPIKSCPSIGFPVPTTAQLTNPDQLVGGDSRNGVIAQQEPNGVYTGGSSGTYVICVAPAGTRYVSYWEGDVQTEGGAAHWDSASGAIVLDGAPSVIANDPKCQQAKTCK
jgi:hypothetical protein